MFFCGSPFIHSFTPPIVSPVTKYRCRNGYRQMMGSIVATVAAARTETGVTAAAALWLPLVLDCPFPEIPGVKKVLLIAGSDKRGTIYGLLNLSELCGVSPLVYWGDVTPLRRQEVVLELPVQAVSKEPSVKHRGFSSTMSGPPPVCTIILTTTASR